MAYLQDPDYVDSLSGLGPDNLPSLSTFINFKNRKRAEDLDAQRQMMDFQSNLRLRELGRNMPSPMPRPTITHTNVPDTNAPKNVVLGPNALKQASIGLEPD